MIVSSPFTTSLQTFLILTLTLLYSSPLFLSLSPSSIQPANVSSFFVSFQLKEWELHRRVFGERVRALTWIHQCQRAQLVSPRHLTSQRGLQIDVTLVSFLTALSIFSCSPLTAIPWNPADTSHRISIFNLQLTAFWRCKRLTSHLWFISGTYAIVTYFSSCAFTVFTEYCDSGDNAVTLRYKKVWFSEEAGEHFKRIGGAEGSAKGHDYSLY